MLPHLPPYPAYRDSGVPWLDEVPEHWEVRRLGQVGALFKGSGGSKEDEVPEGVPCIRYGQLYTTYNYFIERPRSFVSAEHAEAYTPIQYGDVLFAGSGETINEIGKSAVNLLTEDARCGGDVIVFRPRIEVDSRFLGYATDCRPAAAQKATMGRGITVMHVYGDELKRLAIPLPPPEEQATIVRFLDYADRRIRRYVRAKQRLIALLEEQKQAIIHRAVTRGLDPGVRLRPSGVEWLGDIPEHWEVRRLRDSVAAVVNGIWGSDPDGVNDLTCVRVADFDRRRRAVDLSRRTSRSVSERERQRRILEPGDLLLEKSGGGERQPVGTVVLYTHDEPAVCSNFVGRMTAADGHDSRFLVQLHACLYAIGVNVRSIKQTTGIQNLDTRAYLSEFVAFPPLGEQVQIANYLEQEMQDVERLSDLAQADIRLAREYRTRLIADVVTGKLDVREAAARLPEETDEPEPLDDLDLPDGELDDLEADEVEAELAEAVT